LGFDSTFLTYTEVWWLWNKIPPPPINSTHRVFSGHGASTTTHADRAQS
jgi:hypothetical protein